MKTHKTRQPSLWFISVVRPLLFLVLCTTALVAILATGGGGGGGGAGGVVYDTTKPDITFTDTADGDTGVAFSKKISATFTEAMDPSTITTTTFTLKKGAVPVAGTVDYDGVTAVFTPTANLTTNTLYTATITTGAKDIAGNRLDSNITWTFTTGAAADATAPTVIFIDPANAKTGVALNQKIAVTFSEAMDPFTITTTTFTLDQAGAPVAGTVTYAGLIATFTPAGNLTTNTIYTATITTGVKDLAIPGNAKAANKVWTFTTGAAVDATAPTVASTNPANVGTGAALNTKIAATFSEAMDAATITTTTFTLKNGATAVAGTVTSVGLVATFSPAGNLTANTLYTATITTGAKDLAGNALAVNKVWTFTTGATADVTAPTVTLTNPANGAGAVDLNTKIAATFSEAINPATITATTFTLKQGGTAVDGSFTYAGLVATFTPDSNLIAGTLYTATITTGAKDLAGNALAANKVWTFTTGATADATAPTVDITDPATGDIGVALNKKISATFSEAMAPATVTTATFTLDQAGAPVAGTVTYVGVTAVFTPSSNLAASLLYTATITTGAEDLAGNALAANKVWTFTTGAAADTAKPTVTPTSPANLAINVAVNKKVSATFSETMDPLTITTTTFTLDQAGTPVAGTVAYVGLVATFTPASDLATGTVYTATITTGAEDLAGNALAADQVWSFTTIAALPLGPAPVDLGTAGDFVLLAKTGITTTGVSTITGDLGVSPIDSTAITGFGLAMHASNTYSTSALVTGSIYAANYTAPTPTKMTTAISDMATAYTDAAGRVTPDGTELYAGNLTGQTFPPGLYKWGTGVSVNAAGAVTLNGGATDVWIFQIAGDLTMNPGSSVALAGGALAENVFWQVGGGTGVALDTTVAFKGIILAEKAITFNTGATLVNGRALAKTNVTLKANTITAP